MATLDIKRTSDTCELRVLIADGDPTARRALRDSLHGSADVLVVGEAADGTHAVSAARESRPDVALVDIDLPQLGGIATMRRLRAESPGTRVIQIASRNDQDLGMLALLAGSAGFLVKDMDLARLPAVIRGVDSNEAAVSRSFAALLVERLRSLPEAAFTRA